MKNTLTSLAVIVSVFALIIRVKAQGYIVPNGVTYLGMGGLGGYETHVLQNPTSGDYTGFLLNPQSETSFLFSPFADEGVRTFLVSLNDPISLQPILANRYTELAYPNSYVFQDGSPFYLGFYTGYDPWDSHGNYTGIYTDPLFGWGEFVNNGGVIQMLGSALEYGGGGIYAGTQDILPVPEPGVLGIFAAGVLALSIQWLRRRNSPER
jgi:hypothetical protein